MTTGSLAIHNKRRPSKPQRARHPLQIPRPEPPARAKECCALASMGWFAFPGRSNPWTSPHGGVVSSPLVPSGKN